MKNKMARLAAGGLMFLLLQLAAIGICSAEVVEGQAAIIDGNVDKAVLPRGRMRCGILWRPKSEFMSAAIHRWIWGR